jgi:putative endonuclease
MPDRPERFVRGRRAEQLVAELLEERGFIVLAKNLRLGHLEIDLVALEGDLVVIVEVRARGHGAYERPLESLGSSKKRMHLLNAADRLWRLRLSKMPRVKRFRIDVASVDLRVEPPVIHYVEGALTR